MGLLEIAKNYYAKSNNYGYTVMRETKKANENGETTYITLGYVGTVEEAIKLVLKDMVHRRISESVVTKLSEALEYYRQQEKEIAEVLKGVEV